jgi:hypothetical protein
MIVIMITNFSLATIQISEIRGEMSKLIPIEQEEVRPTLDELVLKVNEIAINSQNVY